MDRLDRRELLFGAAAMAGLTMSGIETAVAKRPKKVRVRLTVSLNTTHLESWTIKVEEDVDTFLSTLLLVDERYQLEMGIVLADPVSMPHYQPRDTQGEPLDGKALAGMHGQHSYSLGPLFGKPDESDYGEFFLLRGSTQKVDYRGRLVALRPEEIVNPRFMLERDYNTGNIRSSTADITDLVSLVPPYIPAEMRNNERIKRRHEGRLVAPHYGIAYRLPNQLDGR